MSQSIITKLASLGFAALVTVTIMTSLDALARSEQSQALAQGQAATHTACIAPGRPRS